MASQPTHQVIRAIKPLTGAPRFVLRAVQHRTTIQATVLLSLAVGVVGILWNRELRTAELMRRTALHPIDSLTVPAAAAMTRQDYCSVFDESKLPSFPKVAEDPRRLKVLLREGRTYEVMVKGGLVARLVDNRHGEQSGLSIAYMFEMQYRRAIQQNDGHRIVEHRSFETVRMAKIVSAANDMILNLTRDNESVLDQIPFPHPEEGVVVTSAAEVADRMLVGGVRSVEASPSSRVFLEQDTMSGRSVLMVHEDGVGVESVRALGWQMTYTQARFLLSQPILPAVVLLNRETIGESGSIVRMVHLGSFVEPLRFPAFDLTAVIEPAGNVAAFGRRFSLLRLADARHTSEDPLGIQRHHRTTHVPMGSIEYDTALGIITSATINWCVHDLEIDKERLFYERHFSEDPVLTVHYRCKAL